MNLSKLVCVFLLVLVFNCSNKDNQESISAPSIFKIGDTLDIFVPDSIPYPISRSNLNWNSNEKYLGFLGDPIDNIIPIYTYDINKKKWFNINLNQEGENQVYGMGSFYYNNNNTIYYISSIIEKVFKVDFEGKVLDVAEYSVKHGHGPNNMVFNPQIMIDNSKIGFLSTQFLNMDNVESYQEAKLFTKYNFETDEASHIINFPDEFIGHSWSMNDQALTSVYKGNKIILSFSKSHNLYVYDTEGKLERTVNVKVDGVGDAQPQDGSNSDPMDDLLRNLATGKYTSLIYDKWRDVYYRIGKFYDINNFEPKDFAEINEKRNKQVYVIVVLDKDFEVIGTDYFNHEQLNINASSYFVNKDGLYLNLSNFDDENNLSYVRLSIKI